MTPAPKRRWDWRNAIVGSLGLLFRPKIISEPEALVVVQEAAAARGWPLFVSVRVGRNITSYHGLGFINGTTIGVRWWVDGRTGELLQLDRLDALGDEEFN